MIKLAFAIGIIFLVAVVCYTVVVVTYQSINKNKQTKTEEKDGTKS